MEPSVPLGNVTCTVATEIDSEQAFWCVASIKSGEYSADRLTKLYAELQLPPDHLRQLKVLIDTGDHRSLMLRPYVPYTCSTM